jgi:alkaline phosphatase D
MDQSAPGSALDGYDEPAALTTADDHAGLLSELDSHDIAFALAPEASAEDFRVDEVADRETFPQSVASGGPTTAGVILWTRLAPERYDPDCPVGVEVAHDADFEDVVYRGSVADAGSVEAHDHTLKVDLDGYLEAGEAYRYRFVHDGAASPVGTCRTLPTDPESVRFAVVACQNYLNGYYSAFHHIAEADVDFLVHVGDAIYESDSGHFKGVGSRTYHDRVKDLPSGADRVQGLADYRYLYRVYRSDAFLQEALESHTLVAGWDDHEFANDLHWNDATDAPRADHPRGDDPKFMTRLVADGMHAWWEYMPARVEYDPAADRLQDRFRLWRSFEFGDLLRLVLTDERLFRDSPREGIPTRRAVDPDREPPDRSMLGADQRAWLFEQFDNDATWTVWTDEVLTVPFKLGAGRATLYPVQMGWDGYTRERRAIEERVQTLGLENFVTITGDMHCYVAAYKQAGYRDWLFERDAPEPERLGVEFMTPAVTSVNPAEAVGLTGPLATRLTAPLVSALVELMNPHVEHFDGHRWGYSVAEFTEEACTFVAYSVDKHVDSPDADRSVVRAFRVPEGQTELVDVTGAFRNH